MTIVKNSMCAGCGRERRKTPRSLTLPSTDDIDSGSDLTLAYSFGGDSPGATAGALKTHRGWSNPPAGGTIYNLKQDMR
jgi:hypothetical protein